MHGSFPQQSIMQGHSMWISCKFHFNSKDEWRCQRAIMVLVLSTYMNFLSDVYDVVKTGTFWDTHIRGILRFTLLCTIPSYLRQTWHALHSHSIARLLEMNLNNTRYSFSPISINWLKSGLSVYSATGLPRNPTLKKRPVELNERKKDIKRKKHQT